MKKASSLPDSESQNLEEGTDLKILIRRYRSHFKKRRLLELKELLAAIENHDKDKEEPMRGVEVKKKDLEEWKEKLEDFVEQCGS